jgi:hypothetical protein
MSRSASSVLVFAGYLVGMGGAFILIPNILLKILGFPATNEVWIRVVGVLALVLAFYYVLAARAELRVFIQWTIYARLVVFACFTGFVLVGLAGPIMILLGAIDLVSALWTYWVLRQETLPNSNETTDPMKRTA